MSSVRISQAHSTADNGAIDIESELKNLTSVLEHCRDLINKLSCTSIPENYDDFEEASHENEDSAEQLFHHYKTYKHVVQSLLDQNIDIFNQATNQTLQLRARITALEQSIEERDATLESYSSKLRESHAHEEHISTLYQKARQEIIDLHNQFNVKQKEIETDRSEIRRTFIKVQQENQSDRQRVHELYNTNQQMKRQIEDIKDEKQAMAEANASLEKEISKLTFRIKYIESQLESKERELEWQSSLLTESQKQISKNLQRREDSENENEEKNNNLRGSFYDKPAEQEKTKLSQEVINYNLPSSKQFLSSRRYSRDRKPSHEDFSEIISANNQANHEQARNREIQRPVTTPAAKHNPIFDPYFLHYILLSQSVKIKEDCEGMLGIDMRQYYKVVIDERIPMHLWDQWLRDKLRDLLQLQRSQ